MKKKKTSRKGTLPTENRTKRATLILQKERLSSTEGETASNSREKWPEKSPSREEMVMGGK